MRLFIYLFTIHTLLIYSCKENSTGSNTDSVLSESKTIINSFEYFRNSNTNIDTLSVSLESSESDINLFFNFFISKRNINSYNFTILQYDTSTISNINFVVNSDFIEILWTSIYEENNMGWEIQRKDSNQSYNTIGFVNGSGTSTEIHHYSFNDENEISSLLFYRIKQIDFNHLG